METLVKETALKRGFSSEFKPEQLQCLQLVVEKKDCMAILPTGYGKSLIYQLLRTSRGLQGLKNASGTKFQVNGAAYGKGIYLSPHISTSMSYSRMGYGNHKSKASNIHGSFDGKPRFLLSHDIACIAICEVITSKQLKKSNSIWVCPDAEHVCTRFFFVYEDGRVSDSSIDTQKEIYLKKIQKACGYKV